MSEESKLFLKIGLIVSWIIPVIGFLTFGFVFWSVAMGETGMGAFADRFIYPAAYCWIALPVIGLLSSYRPLKFGLRNTKILAAISLIFNLIYFGVAIFFAGALMMNSTKGIGGL